MRFPISLVADYILSDRNLHGGRKHGFTYLIAVIEGKDIAEVYEGKLLNDFKSQVSPAHPEGYQPFLIKTETLIENETRKYDIKTKTLETIRINATQFIGKYYISRIITKQDARILKTPPRNTEQFYVLEKIRRRTSCQRLLRQLVSSDYSKLEIAAELLQESQLGLRPQCSIIESVDQRFEFYLRYASDNLLEELQSLFETDIQLERAKQAALLNKNIA